MKTTSKKKEPNAYQTQMNSLLNKRVTELDSLYKGVTQLDNQTVNAISGISPNPALKKKRRRSEDDAPKPTNLTNSMDSVSPGGAPTSPQDVIG